MVDGGGKPRLVQKALSKRVVTGQLRCDELQRDGSVEGELGCAVDDPHTTTADDTVDPVAGELSSNFGHVEVRFSTVRSTM